MFVYIANLWENVMIVMNLNYRDRQMFCNHNSHTPKNISLTETLHSPHSLFMIFLITPFSFLKMT